MLYAILVVLFDKKVVVLKYNYLGDGYGVNAGVGEISSASLPIWFFVLCVLCLVVDCRGVVLKEE